MFPAFVEARLVTLRRVLAHRIVRFVLGVWVAVCTYDTALSQLIPEWLGNRFPKVRDAIAMTSGWLPFWAWLLILAIILVIAALEFAVRRSGKTADQIELSSAVSADDEPLGTLDYIVDGIQSLSDISKLQKNTTRHAISLGKFMRWYTVLLNHARTAEMKRKLAARCAKRLSKFADMMHDAALSMKHSAETMERSCLPLVENTEIVTENDSSALFQFRREVAGMVDALIGMSGTVSETQASMRQLMGMSRDMNKATALLSTSTGEFVSEVNTFIERLRRVDEACERKSQLVQAGA